MTGQWGFDCRLRGLLWGTVNWDVKVDRPYMLPGPVVAFALGLYDVAVQHSSLVDNGAIICQGQEQHFLAWA